MAQSYLIFLLFYVVANAQSNDLAAPAMAMPLIDKLDVKCTSSGMLVDLTFTAPFSGTIFSKGHFLDPACRYVQNPSSSHLQFTIPLEKCGTAAVTKDGKPAVENLIVIQGDNRFVEAWDSSRKIICELSGPPSGKTVIQRYRVSMLDFEEVHFPGELSEISVRMKLLNGEWPEVVQLQEIVRIGDPMTVCIEVQNPGDYETEVRNCYAYDSSDINDANTNKLQLTDDKGCPVKNKLFGSFKLDESSTKDKHRHISIMNAFTFPDTMDVFIGCEVEVCRGGCEVCDFITTPSTTKPPVTCDSNFYDPRCPPTAQAPTTTAKPPCNVNDPPSETCPCVAGDERSECNQTAPCGPTDKVDERCPCVTGDQREGCEIPIECGPLSEVNSRCPCVSGDLRQGCVRTCGPTSPVSDDCPCEYKDSRPGCEVTTTPAPETTTAPPPQPSVCGPTSEVSTLCPCVLGDLRPGCVRGKCGPTSPISGECPCEYKDARPECLVMTIPAPGTTTAPPPPPSECGPTSEVSTLCPCVLGDLRPGCVRRKCGPTSPISDDCPCDYKDTRPGCSVTTTPPIETTTATPPPPPECGPSTEVSSRCPCVPGDVRAGCTTTSTTTTKSTTTTTTTASSMTTPSVSKPTPQPPTRPSPEPSGCGPECPDLNHPFHNFLTMRGMKKKPTKKPDQEYRKKRSLTEEQDNVGVVVLGRYRAV